MAREAGVKCVVAAVASGLLGKSRSDFVFGFIVFRGSHGDGRQEGGVVNFAYGDIYIYTVEEWSGEFFRIIRYLMGGAGTSFVLTV
jgi:hypothetical protein